MAINTSKLLRLLDAEHPADVREATALVLGELGLREAQIGRGLCEHLDDSDPAVRLEVIKAVGKLRVESALPRLLARVKDGGSEGEQAARAAARMGAKGTRGLQDLMSHVAPGVRRYIGAALAGGSTDRADAGGFEVLLDKDPAVVEAAARSLAGQVPTLTPTQRDALLDHCLKLYKSHKTRLTPATREALTRLLAAVGDERGAAILWDETLPAHPPEVRAAALQALGKWHTPPTKEQLKRLFTCAADPDSRVAVPSLLLLQPMPLSAKSEADWLGLLKARDPGVRRVAMEKVGDRDTRDVAAALLEQLNHPDRGLRDAALSRLTRLKHGRDALTDAVLGAETADRAWALARPMAASVKDYPEAWRDKVFAQAGKWLEADDRRADALLFLLREADAHDLRDRLQERALHWRKKKAYPTALLYLKLLGRDPAAGFPIRLELAACGLKVSSHDLAHDGRAGDPCLQQFAHLAQQDEELLAAEVEKLKWLDPEELYYVGFHFAEHEGRLKKFAGRVLNLVVKRAGRTKVGQAARNKLRGAALD